MKRSQRKRQLSFAYALRSFTGHLEGTSKSHHTVKNYISDLRAFENFLENGLGSKRVELQQLNLADLDKYQDYLKALGFKTNTRRRKVLTVKKLMKYLKQRKKIAIDVVGKIPAPQKIERIPLTFELPDLISKIRALEVGNGLQDRNRALLWVLAESGCLVSEVTHLQFDSFFEGGVSIEGKGTRFVQVSHELFSEIQRLKSLFGKQRWLFLGFNKYGSLGGPISPRGVELLVKATSQRLGMAKLTPRAIRHSVVRHWIEQGVPLTEIQKRLGLRTPYAFRTFEPLIKAKSNSKTTSTP